MASSFRVDVGTLRPAKKLPDGRVVADAHLTRTGVFEYRNPDGSIRREYRPPEEVFNKDSLESFAMVPVTNDHPPEDLNASNARKYAVGSTGESVRKDDDHVASSIMVYDAATIAEMEKGKLQVSCGYIADVFDEPGVTPGGLKYDSIQRNIRGNHVAIVDVARAGKTAQIRMDAAVMVMNEEDPKDAELAVLRARIDSMQEQITALQDALYTKHVSPSIEE